MYEVIEEPYTLSACGRQSRQARSVRRELHAALEVEADQRDRLVQLLATMRDPLVDVSPETGELLTVRPGMGGKEPAR